MGTGCGCRHHGHRAGHVWPRRAQAHDAQTTAALSGQTGLTSAPVADAAALPRADGTVVSLGFDPGKDGFSFANYGFIAGTELDQHVMREMFGNVVCATAPSDSCTMTPAAQQWASQVSQDMFGGHCYGFSMTALRLFTHNLSPSTFGARTVFGLSLTPALQSEIAADWAEQVLPSVQQETLGGQPSAVISFLKTAFKQHKGPYSLGLYSAPENASDRDGHAVTPIGIADLGGSKVAIRIYDSNKPGTTQAIMVDTKAETWSYQVAINPSQPNGTWSGQGASNELNVVPVTAVEHTQPCPFCGSSSTTGTDMISLGGNPARHAHLLITTSAGDKLGIVSGKLVDQIKGAKVIRPALNAIWTNNPEPVYQVPAGVKFTVTLAGGDPTGSDDAQVHVDRTRLCGDGRQPGADHLLAGPDHGDARRREFALKLLGSVGHHTPTLQLGPRPGPERQAGGGDPEHRQGRQPAERRPGAQQQQGQRRQLPCLGAGVSDGQVGLRQGHQDRVNAQRRGRCRQADDPHPRPDQGRRLIVRRTAMTTILTGAGAALLAALALAACGSSSSSSNSSAPSTTGPATTNPAATATGATTTGSSATGATGLKPPAAVHGATVTRHAAGATGKRATVAIIRRYPRLHRQSQKAHINGLSGLSVTQKVGVLLNSVAGLWKAYFQQSGSQLPAASVVLIADQPTTCGSNQITSSSAPEYCSSNDTIELPLGTIESNIAPLGDSALLLLISDLYGYHVENAIGAFGKGYANVQLEQMDSCFSGAYFYYAESEGYLEPADEQGVNNLLAAEAPSSSGSAAGAVTAAHLAQWFNKGILSNLNPKVCVPS